MINCDHYLAWTDVIRLAWCPTDCCTLAIAYGSCLTIWKLPNFDDTAFAHVVEDDDLPDCARALTIPHPGNLAPRITTLAFSADGRQLACGSESGKVRHTCMSLFGVAHQPCAHGFPALGTSPGRLFASIGLHFLLLTDSCDSCFPNFSLPSPSFPCVVQLYYLWSF